MPIRQLCVELRFPVRAQPTVAMIGSLGAQPSPEPAFLFVAGALIRWPLVPGGPVPDDFG